MSEWPMVKLKELMRKTKSIDPGKYPDEEFVLYSIPAYDNGIPEKIFGRDIGSSKILLKDSDVVLSKIVPHIRRTWVITDGEKQIGSSEWIVFNDDRFDPQFIANYLKSDVFHYQLLTTVAGVGGSLNRARPAAVAELKIPLPPLGEQKRIAEILGEVSKAVELVSRQLEILDHGLKTKMWNDADESSHVSLDHYIQKITSGKSLKEGDSEDYQNSVLKISAVTTGYFNEMEVKPLPKSYDPPESHRANNGDILLSRANTTELVGASALVETSATNLFLPDKLWKLQLKDQVNAYFFWHLLQTKIVRSSISKASSGSGGSMKNISQKAFLAISVPEFSNEVQNQIGNIVREQRALRHLLHRKLSLLQELQKSLSSQAFAGLL